MKISNTKEDFCIGKRIINLITVELSLVFSQFKTRRRNTANQFFLIERDVALGL